MPRRKSPTRSESMEGNHNAVRDEKVPEREKLMLSLTSYRMERIRAAMEWHDGVIPSDAEVKAQARALAYAAWDAYYRQIEKEQEKAIIL